MRRRALAVNVESRESLNAPRGCGMNEIIFLIEEAVEGGFTARALGESIFTEAETLDTLRQQVRDAVNCHFDEGKAPKVIRLHFVREEVLAG